MDTLVNDTMEAATTGEGRRQFERLTFQKSASFTLATGLSFRGMTRDVSIRGAFLLTERQPLGVESGTTGKLAINIGGKENEFECQVAHVREDGLGLHIQKGSQNFGFALTSAIFGEVGMKLGWELESSRAMPVTVQCPGATTATKGRIVRLSGLRLSFCAPSSLLRESRGQEVDVTLHPPQQEPLLFKGRLAPSNLWDQQSPCRGMDQLFALELTHVDSQQRHILDSLARSLQQEHYQRSIKDRAKVNTLLSGPEVRRKNHTEIRDDLQRFFGPAQKLSS